MRGFSEYQRNNSRHNHTAQRTQHRGKGKTVPGIGCDRSGGRPGAGCGISGKTAVEVKTIADKPTTETFKVDTIQQSKRDILRARSVKTSIPKASELTSNELTQIARANRYRKDGHPDE